MKAMKLEMEAMKADKVMKDQQLQMLVAIVESHLKMNIHAAFDEIDVIKANERRMEREHRLAEEATQKNKHVVEEVEVVDGSSSQLDVGEQEAVEDDQEMVEAEVSHEPELLIVGEPSEIIDLDNVLRRVEIIQRKRRARKVLLLEWKTSQFVLVGNAYPVPYSGKVIARNIEVAERRRQARRARGEKIEDDSDYELFGDEDEEDEDMSDDKSDDKPSDKDGKDNDDDNDQGASGLLISDPAVQEKIDQLMNNEINEQEDEVQNEASSSGKQPVDQVLLTNPTVLYLNAQQEGEVVIGGTRAEMLEELGLDEGKFKFDIEDEIPDSLAFDFEPRYAFEADHYDDVIIEDASDSEEDGIDFHYDGVDELFPCLAEMFKDRNEEEIGRKIEEKISPEGVQYFERLSDIASLPWWDVDELVKTKNIKQFYYDPEGKQHDQKLWNYIKWQAKKGYPDWKPQYPKQIVTYLESGKKDITLDVKPPRCLKNMSLRAIEQVFCDLFQGWLYNQSTVEAVISLYDKSTGES
ncbi:hypothetical protein Hanom_Chr09g00825191 [Helianthus anomalus]